MGARGDGGAPAPTRVLTSTEHLVQSASHTYTHTLQAASAKSMSGMVFGALLFTWTCVFFSIWKVRRDELRFRRRMDSCCLHHQWCTSGSTPFPRIRIASHGPRDPPGTHASPPLHLPLAGRAEHGLDRAGDDARAHPPAGRDPLLQRLPAWGWRRAEGELRPAASHIQCAQPQDRGRALLHKPRHGTRAHAHTPRTHAPTHPPTDAPTHPRLPTDTRRSWGPGT